MNAEAIKKDFPILGISANSRRLVYLDSAATTQKPVSVINAVVGYYETTNANVHRSAHFLAQRATEAHEDARKKVAGFIGAEDEREIIFVRNATEAINLASYSWGRSNLHSGDEVLLSSMEHHSNLVPWQAFRKRGVKIRFVKIGCDYSFDYSDFDSKIGKKTKLVAITHKSNVLGTTADIKRISKTAHEFGAAVLVDGAQSAPSMPVRVSSLGCDFFAFSGHKMLGPMGIGALYAKAEILESMPPFLYGGDMISSVSLAGAKWNGIPHKFEAGTPDVAGAVGLDAAMDYLKGKCGGMEKIRSDMAALTGYAMGELSNYPFVSVYGSKNASKRPGVIHFTVAGVHPHDVSEILDGEGVAIRTGYHCAQPLVEKIAGGPVCRASLYVYNTREDVDALCAGVEKTAKTFGVK